MIWLMPVLFSTKRLKTLCRICLCCLLESAHHVGKVFDAVCMVSLKLSFVDSGQDLMTASEGRFITLKILLDLDMTH